MRRSGDQDGSLDFVDGLELLGVNHFEVFDARRRFALEHGEALFHHFAGTSFACLHQLLGLPDCPV